MIESRQAILGEDDLFLFEVYASSRREELALWGWNEEGQRQFLQMQHSCQQRSYQMQYVNLECRIIMAEGTKAGRMLTAVTNSEMVLVDIILLPEFQNKGIGFALLKQLQREAARAGLPVRLSVREGNPAKHLYERCGFQLIDSTGIYTTMKWTKREEEVLLDING